MYILATMSFNSLPPGRSWCGFENVIFNLALLIDIFKSSYDNVLRWMPQNLTDDKSTLVQVKAWCHQATRHYLSQCWPRSLSAYGFTRPQWGKRNLAHWTRFPVFPVHAAHMVKDLSMMYRALWDRRHEGATRISQCTRRVAPSALTYPSGPWVPPISQCTIHHA